MPNFIKKNSGYLITDILFWAVLVSVVFLSWRYIPLVYKQQELQAVVKDYTFKTSLVSDEKIRQAVIEDAKRKCDIDLAPEDVEILRNDSRIKIIATWRTGIDLLFDYEIPRVFNVEYERKSLN